MMDRITVNGQGGPFAAYIARPKTSPAPAVVVLQELFGVNADIRKTCDELAEHRLRTHAERWKFIECDKVGLSRDGKPSDQFG